MNRALIAPAIAFLSWSVAVAEPPRTYRIARDQHFYKELYPSGGETLYCAVPFTDRDRLNVEHALPASWMKAAAGCVWQSRDDCRRSSPLFNLMEADLHNLWPSLGTVNRARSNHRLGVIGADAIDSYGKTACDFEVDRSAGLAEPAPSARGPLARSMLYMADTYGIVLPAAQRAVMLDWHCAYPVTGEERRRDDVIARIQHNRNPYIEDGLRGCGNTLQLTARQQGSLPLNTANEASGP